MTVYATLSLSGVRFRPLGQWPGRLTPDQQRQRARFRMPWAKTIALLDRELRHLDARDLVVQVDVAEREIRRDGLPYAHARVGHPGVILAFTSRHGPLTYAVDTYTTWQDNVHAVVLALAALRAVDRYGVTRAGEQYRGWQALPAPAAASSEGLTVEAAARFVAEHANAGGLPVDADDVLGGWLREAYRAAANRLHPDRGGSAALWHRLDQAKRLLDEWEAIQRAGAAR